MKQKMTRLQLVFAAALTVLLATGCSSDDTGKPATPPEPEKPVTAVQSDRPAWYTANPEGRKGDTEVSSETYRLEFFGWGEQDDKQFTMTLPQNTGNFRRAILSYRMGSWNKGPSEWDNTTMLFIRNKADGQWYELARAFTPYGGGFNSTWQKTFFLDVTEYLPMLSGETQFRLYYGGFDATDERAHTVTLGFNYYDGTPERNVVYTAKVYDSSSTGNTGYRGWAYGVADAPIEAGERLGLREFDLPAEVRSLALKVSISGHGHDLGDFPDRADYQKNNAAEFVENTYKIVLNGETQPATGRIFYSNADNYWQAGTYLYDRANWGPGNPLYIHYWDIANLPAKGGKMTLDLDLERFVSTKDAVNAEGVAQYIVEVDLFGYDR